MIEPQPADATRTGSVSPHRRDWLLLPAISVATLLLLVGTMEGVARLLFRSSGGTIQCLVVNDPKTGVRALPRSFCTEKIAEGGMVAYRFNDCGFRTDLPCGPKPPNTFRVVLLGSSLAEGMRVPQEQTFAARLPALLSQGTGRRVEVYNEAMQWGTPASIAGRTSQILAAQPDLVLWTVTPWDFENVSLVLPYVAGVQEGWTDEGPLPASTTPETAPKNFSQRIAAAFHKHGSVKDTSLAAWTRISDRILETRSLLMLQHLLYRSDSQYIRHYAMQGDSAGFLRTPMPPPWQKRMSKFDADLQQVQTQLHISGVPLALVLLPHHAQAVMLSTGSWPQGLNPSQLGDALEGLAQKDGATYIDILHDFRTVPDAGDLYYPVDGHMTPQGQGELAVLLSRELNRTLAQHNASALSSVPAGSGAQP